jgi:hypothetical protein
MGTVDVEGKWELLSTCVSVIFESRLQVSIWDYLFLFFFFSGLGLGFELRASLLVGR